MFGLFGSSTKERETQEKLDRLYRELSDLEQKREEAEISASNAEDNIAHHERRLDKVKDKLDDLHHKWSRFYDEGKTDTVREIDHLIQREESNRREEERSIDRWQNKLNQASRELRQIKREMARVKEQIDDLNGGSW
jgi:predicted  nucleic acid-binding Zn-ribbon protein